jgi:hypothetical protein
MAPQMPSALFRSSPSWKVVVRIARAAGEITAAFADSERACIRQVIEHLQQKIAFAAEHPQPSADDF